MELATDARDNARFVHNSWDDRPQPNAVLRAWLHGRRLEPGIDWSDSDEPAFRAALAARATAYGAALDLTTEYVVLPIASLPWYLRASILSSEDVAGPGVVAGPYASRDDALRAVDAVERTLYARAAAAYLLTPVQANPEHVRDRHLIAAGRD